MGRLMSAYDVFISYARQDGRDHADHLYRELDQRGLKVWRDERNINPFQDFSGEIEIAIESSSHVVVCLTPSIAERKDSFVRREIIYAQGCHKPITPLVFPSFPRNRIPTLINHLTWEDFSVFEEAFPRLLQRVRQQEFVAPTTDHDPFAEYLNALYKQIVSLLDATVFSLITLRTKSDPSSVTSVTTSSVRALPMGFGCFRLKESSGQPEFVSEFDSFEEAFQAYEGRLLLLGEPGSGKTTTLMAFARDYVARRIETPSLPVPLIAPISTWAAEEHTDLISWLADVIPALPKASIESLVAANEALFIFDGLDELGEVRTVRHGYYDVDVFDPRQRFLDLIVKTDPKTKIVVSCRIREYESIGEKVALAGALRLLPLTDAQLEEYLFDEPFLLKAIQQDQTLRDMVQTPLLLALLTVAYKGIGGRAVELQDFSHSPQDLRDRIFATYISSRYEFERQKPHPKLPFDLPSIYDLLGHIAADDVNALTDNRIPLWKIEKVVTQQNSDFVDEMRRLHFLVHQGEDNYRFIRLLLRDYLAFKYCLDRLLPDVIDVFVINTLVAIRDKRTVQPFVKLIHHPDPIIRKEVIWALGTFRDPGVVPQIILMLTDDDLQVRRNAIDALRNIGDPSAQASLVPLLLDADPWISWYARIALAKLKWTPPPEIVEKTRQSILDDSNEAEQSSAIEFWGDFGLSPVSLLEFSKVVKNDRASHDIFRTLLRVEIGSQLEEQVITEALRHKSPEVVQMALERAYNSGRQEILRAFVHKKSSSEFIGLAYDYLFELATDPLHVDELLDKCLKSRNPHLRGIGLKHVTRSLTKSAETVVWQSVLSDKDITVRADAGELLVQTLMSQGTQSLTNFVRQHKSVLPDFMLLIIAQQFGFYSSWELQSLGLSDSDRDILIEAVRNTLVKASDRLDFGDFVESIQQTGNAGLIQVIETTGSFTEEWDSDEWDDEAQDVDP